MDDKGERILIIDGARGPGKSSDLDLFKDREAVNVPVHGPRKVQLYKTNRKQRRAQQAYNRKHKKDKPL